MIKICEICGQQFDAIFQRQKCCSLKCKAVAAKNKRDERDSKPRNNKPQLSPQEQKLAELRKKLSEATTPAERSKYFREYVFLKQELSRVTKGNSDVPLPNV